MFRTLLILSCLPLVACSAASTSYTHDHRFTIPFARDVSLTVWEPQRRSVELHLGAPKALLAPGDVYVLNVWQGEIVLSDLENEAVIVLDGIDHVDVDPDSYLCGGELIGKTQQVRVRAYWGLQEFENAADLSLVRVVRNSVVTDLSDVRIADQVQSALTVPDKQGLRSDINWDDCPIGGRGE